MTEQRLHVAQIGAAAEQMRRVRVAQRVRGQRNADPMAGVVDADAEAGRLQATAAAIDEERRLVGVRQHRPRVGEIAIERLGRRGADGHDPIFAAFAGAHEYDAGAEIEIGEIEAYHFSQTQARPIEQLENRAVALADRLTRGWRGHHAMGLRDGDHAARERSIFRDREDVCGIPEHDLALGEKVDRLPPKGGRFLGRLKVGLRLKPPEEPPAESRLKARSAL